MDARADLVRLLGEVGHSQRVISAVECKDSAISRPCRFLHRKIHHLKAQQLSMEHVMDAFQNSRRERSFCNRCQMFQKRPNLFIQEVSNTVGAQQVAQRQQCPIFDDPLSIHPCVGQPHVAGRLPPHGLLTSL